MTDLIKELRSWKIGSDATGRVALLDLLLFVIFVYLILRWMGVGSEVAVLIAIPGVPPLGS
jgi:hypothetical protein